MNEILTVSQLTTAIKKQLESRFSLVSVQGEISNLKEQASGHLYFTLKDAEAQISTVLFKGTSRLLSRLPKGGDQVVVRGEISVYAPRGNYQLIVRELEYAGVGQLLLKLHELKNKLASKGWFDPAIKKKLPKYPRTIGVVTSPTGAVIQDILNILTRRSSGVHLILNPVKVQGEGAAQEIARAIAQFNRYNLADLLIVGRGGGSLEDLWAFNEECVAEAIFHSQIPIISAVGHETDYSIADFVADLRAPTPSAAAEIAVAEKGQQLRFLKQSHDRLSYTVRSLTAHHRKTLDRVKKYPHLASPYPLLGPHLQRVDGLRTDLEAAMRQDFERKRLKLQIVHNRAAAIEPSAQIQTMKEKLGALKKAFETAGRQQISTRRHIINRFRELNPYATRMAHLLSEKKNRLQQLVSHLKAIDPKNLLTKGYCILFQEKKDSVILSSRELEADQKVRIALQDGQALATITGVRT